MKKLQPTLKEMVQEVLREHIQDPTKEEMLAYLKQQYGNEEGFQDSAEIAIYWFANFNHGGQWSNLYSVLSTSPVRPGPIARGPEKGSMEEMMFKDLSMQFADGEGLDKENDVQESSGNTKVKVNELKNLIKWILRESARLDTTAQVPVSAEMAFKKSLFAELAKHEFQSKGNTPNDYMEYYVWNFATVQVEVSVLDKTVRVEKYYDNETFADKNVAKTWPIPQPAIANNFIAIIVKLCEKLTSSAKADNSLFGGEMDEAAGQSQQNKLTPKEKRQIGEAFAKAGLDGNGRFPKIEVGLSAVTNVLASLGFNLDMVSSDQIRGDKGSQAFTFRRSNDAGADPFTEKSTISNSRIAFSWENLSNAGIEKKFEILAYAS